MPYATSKVDLFVFMTKTIFLNVMGLLGLTLKHNKNQIKVIKYILHPTITCSQSAEKALEQGVIYMQK